jgi:hypothetical protein
VFANAADQTVQLNKYSLLLDGFAATALHRRTAMAGIQQHSNG